MENYIDAFVLPIPRIHLDEYKRVAETVASIWKEHGAVAYRECVSDDVELKGTRSFAELANAKEGEVIIFGWTTFPSKQARDIANERVAADPRMKDLIAPLIDPSKVIFSAERMAFGGFRSLVSSS